MTDSMTVFNRDRVRRHRERAAAAFEDHDFLMRESAARLLDRLDDVKRTFPVALDLGCHAGGLAAALEGRGGIETLVQCDLAPAMAAQARDAACDAAKAGKRAGARAGGPARFALAADEEALPFADGAFDLVLSNLTLHWANDLPGALVQARRALRPDGLFLAAILGAGTLAELARSLAEAEIAEEDGLSPRISPFADVRDLGALLQRAGFALPVVDADAVTVHYDDPMALMADLRGMGETNALIESRKGMTRSATMAAAAERYSRLFGQGDGTVPATFRIVTLTGWAPDPSQQRPLKPGSAEARLADALDADEVPLPDKAKP